MTFFRLVSALHKKRYLLRVITSMLTCCRLRPSTANRTCSQMKSDTRDVARQLRRPRGNFTHWRGRLHVTSRFYSHFINIKQRWQLVIWPKGNWKGEIRECEWEKIVFLARESPGFGTCHTRRERLLNEPKTLHSTFHLPKAAKISLF